MPEGPIVIGGTGGSGTRLICQIFQAAGVFMGEDINYALDSLPMASFDDHVLNGIADYNVFKRCLGEHLKGHVPRTRWGWKHTRSYMTLAVIKEFLPDVQFVHVLRDGRDMAYAPHLSYRVFWTGSATDAKPSPEGIMALWGYTNMMTRRVAKILEIPYFAIRYEDLFTKCHEVIRELWEWAGVKGNLEEAARLPKVTGKVGRYQGREEIGKVTEAGRLALEEFGYI